MRFVRLNPDDLAPADLFDHLGDEELEDQVEDENDTPEN